MARYSVYWKLKNGGKELTGTYSGIEAKNENSARDEAIKRINQHHAKVLKEWYTIAEIKVK